MIYFLKEFLKKTKQERECYLYKNNLLGFWKLLFGYRQDKRWFKYCPNFITQVLFCLRFSGWFFCVFIYNIYNGILKVSTKSRK